MQCFSWLSIVSIEWQCVNCGASNDFYFYSTPYCLDPPVYTVNDRFAVIEGERLLINLTLDANPTPGQENFTWSFNGIELSQSGDLNFGLDFIDFGVVNRNEAGSYMVEATNLAGTGDAMFQLVVYCKY